MCSNPAVLATLQEGYPLSRVLVIDTSHPFWPMSNKTMMAGKNFQVNLKSVILETDEKFSKSLLDTKVLLENREDILTRLIRLVADWLSMNSIAIFTGMDSTVEFALRDCTRTENIFTPEIYYYAESLGILPDQAYDKLDLIAADNRKRRMHGLSFIHKYSRMINAATDTESLKKINALMYQDWTIFQDKFTKEKP
jgi:hypothetical protein